MGGEREKQFVVVCYHCRYHTKTVIFVAKKIKISLHLLFLAEKLIRMANCFLLSSAFNHYILTTSFVLSLSSTIPFGTLAYLNLQTNNNAQYPILSRVRELGLLEKTAELGVLSKLEKQGLTLEKAEELLPLLENLGLLSLVANNQQLLINGVAPLAIEGAPLLLPLVAGALDIGPAAFYLGAAGAAGLDAYLFVSGTEVPFLGLSAGAVAGLLLIPLSVVLAVVGGAIGSLKK